MKRHAIADFGQPASEAPLSYPGALPAGPFVYDGSLWLVDGGDPVGDVTGMLLGRGSLPLAERFAVICSGSNASPPQIHRKISRLKSDRLIPFMPARLPGLSAVYAGHVARYGALPATLESSADSGELFVAFYTPRQLYEMYKTEHGNYHFAELPDVELGLPLPGKRPAVYAFLSKKGVLILDEASLPLRSLEQREILARVFERLSSIPGLASLETYCEDPKAHREELDSAIGANGLRLPHTVPHVVHDLDELLGATG